MVLKTVYATESESPFSEGVMVSLPVTYGSMTYGPTTYGQPQMTYEQPPLSSEQETRKPTCWQERARRKSSYNKYTTPVSQSSVQQIIPVQSNVQSVQQPQVPQDQDPVTPNLGRPSAFRRSSNCMTLSSNRTTSTTSTEPESPNLGMQTESPKEARLRRIIEDSLWGGTLLTYYRCQSVKFKLSSLQLQELEKLDNEISNIRDNTGRYDCKLLMKKFLLLESYNIPDIGGVYDDEVISKNFPMDLLRMILLAKGRNTDNLSKTQMINELNSYNRTVLAFTMVPSKVWSPDL